MKHKYEEATDVEIEYLEAWDRESTITIEDPITNSIAVLKNLTREEFKQFMLLHTFANNS